jgi:hypothetical protein
VETIMARRENNQSVKKITHRRRSFFYRHSLGLASTAILMVWIVLYCRADPETHWGMFVGNAIADWTGVAVTVFATKYLYEKGSAESRNPGPEPLSAVARFFHDHSLLIFLVPTGLIWTVIFLHSQVTAKWGGEVVGNIVSEWTQLIGLVVMTKKLVEQHSKESARQSEKSK